MNTKNSPSNGMDLKKDFKVEKLEGSRVKITGEIPFEELAKHKAAAVKALGRNIKVDGFREGHVSEAVLIAKVGEMAVLTEAAEKAISATYPKVVEIHELETIGYPEISITKIAEGSPLGFSATATVLPEIKLPDYKKIAKELSGQKGEVSVTDEDVENQIKDILRQKAAYERLQKKAAAGEKETHTHDDGTVHEGPAHDDDGKPLPDPDLVIPELTDKVVKTLGAPGQFETVADFKQKLREHLEIEKKREAEGKHRANVTDKIIEGSHFELPALLVDTEIAQMFGQMEEDIKRAGLSMDDYLNHMKKTREELTKEWTPAAEKRARLQLVLNEIAKKEKVEPDPEAVETETKHLLEQYKNADINRVRIYVASVLQNEAVMKMLEAEK
ncbi:MAG: trigger factor [Candidatus Paceibacterota bacterium]